MVWPILRRLGAIAAVTAAALAVFLGDRSTLSTLGLVVLAVSAQVALLAAAVLLVVVPKYSLAWLASLTAIAVSGLAVVGRPGRFEAVATVAVAVVGPVVLLLLATASRGAHRRAMTVTIAAVAVAAVVRALVYDPFADIACRGLCRPNPVGLATNLGLAHLLGVLIAGASAVISVGIVAGAIQARRTSRRNSLDRSAELAIVAAASLLGIDAAARLVSGKVAVPGDTAATVLAVVFVAVLLASGALILIALDPLRARRDVGRVARLLASDAGTTDPQAILRAGFGDPGLLVGYWAEGIGYLDEHGDVLRLPSSASSIELTAHGAPLAVIVHTPDAVSSDAISRHLGSRARLAIHNESLALELNRSIAELERSRRRIVDAGDRERRHLERDLHDGAQQRLLALSFELRRGERAAQAAEDTDSARAFSSANELALDALQQLRGLAHGIHPAILDGAGLYDALMALGTAGGQAMTLDIDLDTPVPPSVRSATYGIVAAAIADGTPTATPVVTIRRHGAQITVEIDHVVRLPEHAIDRAEAVGGSWTATERGFEVALPCAW
jgi:signal transduction histidine kinase